MRAAGAATLLILLLAAAPAGAAPYSSVNAVGKTGGGILRFPQAIAYDDSGVADPGAGAPAGPYVYVADQYSFLVQKFTRSGAFVRDWGGFGTAAGRFGNASGDTVGGIAGLAVDGAGRVYVLDSYNDRIQQFTPGGTFVRGWGTTGTAPGQFQLGIGGGLAVRGSSLFVADQNNHRVQRFTLDASGAPVGTPLAFGSLGTGDGQLDHPQGIGLDATAVYVADDRNDRVVKFSHDGAYLGKVGTTGTGASQFDFAYDAGVDSLGRLYVADNNNHRVQEFDAATFAYRRRWGLLGTEVGRFGYPRSLAGVKGDPAGGVFVGDTSNNRVQSFAPDATSRGVFGTNARGPGLFMQPKSVAAGKDGSLWVADTFSDRIQRFDGSTWSAVAGTTFNAPRGVAVDASGRLLVADTGNNRVVRLAGTTWSAVGSGYARPEAVTTAASSVSVADTGNSRVLKLDAASGALQRTVASAGTGSGQVLEPEGVAVDAWGNVLADTWGGNGTGPGQLIKPAQIQLDGDGSPWVADQFNNRVRRYTLSTWTVGSTPATLIVARNATGSTSLRVTPTGGFARPVALSLSGCPANATCSVSPSTLTPTGTAYPTATLRIAPRSTTPRGKYVLQLTGTTASPTIRRTSPVTVTVS